MAYECVISQNVGSFFIQYNLIQPSGREQRAVTLWQKSDVKTLVRGGRAGLYVTDLHAALLDNTIC